jgi:chromosome segregation ATPase
MDLSDLVDRVREAEHDIEGSEVQVRELEGELQTVDAEQDGVNVELAALQAEHKRLVEELGIHDEDPSGAPLGAS